MDNALGLKRLPDKSGKTDLRNKGKEKTYLNPMQPPLSDNSRSTFVPLVPVEYMQFKPEERII